MIVAPGMRSSWKRRLVERAELAAMKQREAQLKEAAKKEKEVVAIPGIFFCFVFDVRAVMMFETRFTFSSVNVAIFSHTVRI